MQAQTGREVEVWWSKSREEPWRAQAASPRQSRSNPILRGNRVDTIFRAGLRALLFFFEILCRDVWNHRLTQRNRDAAHDAYGTPRDLFGKFFGVIAETVHEVLDDDWSPEIDAAWRRLLADIDTLVAQSQAEIGA